MIASDGCPSGYAERDGGLFGFSSDIGRSLDLTRHECALKCSGEKNCISFQHSYTQMKCNLSEIAEPSQAPYLDFIFCTKTGIFSYVVNVSLYVLPEIAFHICL